MRSRPSWHCPTSRSGSPSPSKSPTNGAAWPERSTSRALPLASTFAGAASSTGGGGPRATAKAAPQSGIVAINQRMAGSPLPGRGVEDHRGGVVQRDDQPLTVVGVRQRPGGGVEAHLDGGSGVRGGGGGG